MLTNENVKKNKGVGVARDRPPNSAIQARCLSLRDPRVRPGRTLQRGR